MIFIQSKFIELVNKGMVQLNMGAHWTDVRDIQRDGLKYGNDGAYYAEIPFVKIQDVAVGRMVRRSRSPVFQYGFYGGAIVYNLKEGIQEIFQGIQDVRETVRLNEAAQRSFYISFVYTPE